MAAAFGLAHPSETKGSPVPGRLLSSLCSEGSRMPTRPHTYSEGTQSTSTGSMPAVTPSSSEWESLLDEAHEPSQEALNSIVDMLNAQKARLLQENHMLSLESEIVRLSKENEALRASVEAAYVYNPMPLNPMVLPAPVLMPMEFQGVDSALPAPWNDTEEADLDGEVKPQTSPKAKAAPGIRRVGKLEPKEAAPFVADPEGRTTVMLRNLPNNYTRDMLLELIDSLGFRGQYGFGHFVFTSGGRISCTCPLTSRPKLAWVMLLSIWWIQVSCLPFGGRLMASATGVCQVGRCVTSAGVAHIKDWKHTSIATATAPSCIQTLGTSASP
ncbi:unnamed protein product [Durusdinium trenchii]|uniref:Uncharacterized protein n=2 Tax=Durusdinium trenchii TaxID=1381693 RepID=A0ABP0LNB7_9DINO